MSKKLSKQIISLFTLTGVLGLFVFFLFSPLRAAACTCFTTTSDIVSIDNTADCQTACDGDLRAQELDDSDGICSCSNSTSTTIDCETLCSDEGYFHTPLTSGLVQNTASTPLVYPQLGIPIPGVSFSGKINDEGWLETNFIAAYISGVYRYLISISLTIAIVMIMIGGIQYVIGGAGQEQVSKAKTRIGNAVIGLVLLLSVYIILFTVNPQLILLESLRVKVIEKIVADIPSTGETDTFDSPQSVTIPEGSTVPSHSALQNNGNFLNEAVKDDFYLALDEFYEATGQTAIMTSGFRTGQKQMQLFWDQCLKNPNGKCSPVTGAGCTTGKAVEKNAAGGYDRIGVFASMSREEFIEKAGALVNPACGGHLSSVAVDLWCSKNLQGDFVFDTRCQIELTKAMLNHGFCRLTAEAWHFEYATMSPSRKAGQCFTKGENQPYMQNSEDFAVYQIWDADKDQPEKNVTCKDFDSNEHICKDTVLK